MGSVIYLNYKNYKKGEPTPELAIRCKIMFARKFNETLSPEAQTKIVDFKAFKKFHKERNDKFNLEKMVAYIEKVTLYNDCVIAYFESGSAIRVGFNGTYEKYNCKQRLSSTGGVGTGVGIDKKGHIKISVNGIQMYLERFIILCLDVANNELALSYKGWTSNVKDGSGSIYTAKKLGIPVNFCPGNLEWCLCGDNAVHGHMIQGMKYKTGHVYRFSANNRTLREIYCTKSDAELKKYCDANLILVR